MNEANILKYSFKEMFKHPVVFTPNILLFVWNIIALLFYGQITDWNFLSGIYWWQTLIYLAVVLLVDNYIVSCKYAILRKLVQRKKITLKNVMTFADKHFLDILKVHALTFSIITLPFILLVKLSALSNTLSFILSICIVAYLVLMSIRLLFIYPELVFHEKGVMKSITKEMHFTKTHSFHTHVVWITTLSILFLIDVVQSVINSLGMLILFGTIMIIGLEIFVSVWEHMYIFAAYSKTKLNKQK